MPISVPQTPGLTAHETISDRAKDEAVKSLRAIHDGKLYRKAHKTFEAYCRERWGMSNSHATPTHRPASVNAHFPHALYGRTRRDVERKKGNEATRQDGQDARRGCATWVGGTPALPLHHVGVFAYNTRL